MNAEGPAGADREQALTDEVLASFAGTSDPRLLEILRSLVRHLHGFAREVRLSQSEWEAGIDFLTRAGHLTDDRRQEFILLSDVLGLSMLTVAINEPATLKAASAGEATEVAEATEATEASKATEATVFGPFYVDGAPQVPLGGDIGRGAAGTPCYVSGHVLAADGTPLKDVRVDVWGADENGFYDVQYPGERSAGRGWLRTASDGGFRFWTVLPTPYPIPHDGPVGDLLAAAGRSPMRPAHLHFKVAAPGYRTLITHIFVAGDPYLDSDAVFGVKDSLVVEAEHHDGGQAPDGSRRDGAWTSMAYDFVLVPAADSD